MLEVIRKKTLARRLFIVTLILTLLLSQFPILVTAQVPTLEYKQNGFTLRIPDWNQITFSALPALTSGGEVRISPQYVKMLGYNPNRAWSAGTKVDRVIMLGDVAGAFGLQRFSLNSIDRITQISLSNLPLKDLELINWQTPSTLARAIPMLRTMAIDNIPVLRDFFNRVGLYRYIDPYIDGKITLEDAISLLPKRLVNKTLGEVLNLDRYKLSNGIPGLTTTQLGKFLGWQQSFISGVPLLNRIPFNQFPIAIPFGIGGVALADIMWGDSEYGDPSLSDGWFVSGSAKYGRNKPLKCQANQPCPYIELSGLFGSIGLNHGKRWVVGKYQKVPGGEGILGAIAGGKEPTGRLVFGSAFKMILMHTDESKGTATFGINFRVCKRGLIDLGCTPYFIGSIPLFTVREGDLVLLN